MLVAAHEVHYGDDAMRAKLFSTMVMLSWAVALGCGGRTSEVLPTEARPADVVSAGSAGTAGVVVEPQPTAPEVVSSDAHDTEPGFEAQPIPEVDGDSGAGGAPADSPPGVVEVPAYCAGRATTIMSVTANLDADAKAISTAAIVGPPSVAANPWNAQDAANTANFSTSMIIYDSRGLDHWLDIYFRKSDTEARTWDYHVILPATEVVGGVADGYFDAGGGTLRFASNGSLSSDSGSPVTIAFSGTSVAQTITIDLAGRSRAGGAAGGVTNFAGISNVSAQIQDGAAAHWGADGCIGR